MLVPTEVPATVAAKGDEAKKAGSNPTTLLLLLLLLPPSSTGLGAATLMVTAGAAAARLELLLRLPLRVGEIRTRCIAGSPVLRFSQQSPSGVKVSATQPRDFAASQSSQQCERPEALAGNGSRSPCGRSMPGETS